MVFYITLLSIETLVTITRSGRPHIITTASRQKSSIWFIQYIVVDDDLECPTYNKRVCAGEGFISSWYKSTRSPLADEETVTHIPHQLAIRDRPSGTRFGPFAAFLYKSLCGGDNIIKFGLTRRMANEWKSYVTRVTRTPIVGNTREQ